MSRMGLGIFAATLLMGCPEPAFEPPPMSSAEALLPGNVLWFRPARDAVEVYAPRLGLGLDLIPTDPRLSVHTLDGQSVPVSAPLVEASGEWGAGPEEGPWGITVVPDPPLARSTGYYATFSSDEIEPVSWRFTTGELGAPLAVPTALPGAQFLVDMSGDAAWTRYEPQGLGFWMSFYVSNASMLVSISPESRLADGVLHVGIGSGQWAQGPTSEQDLCVPTFAPTAGPDGVVGTGDDQPGLFDDPFLEFGPADVAVLLGYAVVTLQDLTFSGMLWPDGQRIGSARMAFTLDTRELADDFSPPGDSFCFGDRTVGCVPCDDGQPWCVDFSWSNFGGDRVPGGSLVPRSASDIADDPACP
mgnify:CR=1 FL=1